MRTYDFTKNYEKLLTPDIVALLTQIHEYKGEQALFIEAKADTPVSYTHLIWPILPPKAKTSPMKHPRKISGKQ